MLKAIKILLKRSLLGIAIVVTIAIILLSTLKISAPPIDFNYADKVQHLIAYFTLSFCWLLALKNKGIKTGIILIMCILLGVFLEFYQGTLPYRSFEYLDMIANTLGVIIGYILFKVFIKSALQKNLNL